MITTIIILNLISLLLNIYFAERMKEDNNSIMAYVFTLSALFSVLLGFVILFIYFCIALDALYYDFKNK